MKRCSISLPNEKRTEYQLKVEQVSTNVKRYYESETSKGNHIQMFIIRIF